MHNDLTYTLQLMEELGQHKLVDALAEAFDIGTQASSRGGQSGGSQGGGRRGGGRAGHARTVKPDPIYEEGMTQVQKSHGLALIGYYLTMVAGHRDARLALVLGHPTPPIMRTLFRPKLCLVVLAQTMRTLLVCHPQFSVDLPMMVNAYLSPHQAWPPHL